MNNTKKLQEARARKQYLQSELVKIESEIEKLYLLNDEYILTKDYDGDGIVSYIDYYILMDACVGANHSTLYNPQNNTYNGKSLDVYADGKVDISDVVGFVNDSIEYLKSNVPIDIEIGIKDYNDKQDFSFRDFMRSYKSSHNGEYPTLNELKAAYNNA